MHISLFFFPVFLPFATSVALGQGLTSERSVQHCEFNFTGRHLSPHEYLFAGTARSWSDAEHICRKHGSWLPKITDGEKDIYQFHEIARNCGSQERTSMNLFLGLTKEHYRKEWSWALDEEIQQYWNHEPGLLPPSISKDERCCSFSSSRGFWHPIPCHRRHRTPMLVICQRKKRVHFSCNDYPCENEATCINSKNAEVTSPEVKTNQSFTCKCLPGFHGNRCEHELNECNSNPCSSHGLCLDNINGFSCLCDADFTDKICATQINDCINHQCQNGAMCVDGVAGYSCSCPDGYEGGFCEHKVEIPSTSPKSVVDKIDQGEVEQLNSVMGEQNSVANTLSAHIFIYIKVLFLINKLFL